MTERNPALWMQNRTDHTAEQERALFGILLDAAGLSGVSGSGDLAVTQSGTPAMSVSVAAGKAVVSGTENANQGQYAVWNDAAKTLTISAADGSNPRRDIIVARIKDAAYSGASNTFTLEVITGTPAASPSDPTIPANCLQLARVAVAAGASSITNANITDLRTRTIPNGIAPGCIVERTATQSFTDGVVANLSWTATDVYDPLGFHDPAYNDDHITIPTGMGGIYLFNMVVTWQASSDGRRQHLINVNGTEVSQDRSAPVNAGVTNSNFSAVVSMTAGQYLTVSCAQTSGVTLTATSRASLFRLSGF